jgi:8-oxo-dGTP pyrophosphatase MutT (NUDIX family)
MGWKMEKRDLYDAERNLTGETILKGEKIPEGKYIVVVLVFIQNSDEKFLIQKRSKIKNGKFATTGGHTKSGESSIQGILTEVEEEIGLKLNPNDLQLYFSGKSESEKVFCDDYYIKKDIEDISCLKLQKEEVDYVKWFSKNEIENLMSQDKFLKSHYEDFEVLLKWLDKKI